MVRVICSRYTIICERADLLKLLPAVNCLPIVLAGLIGRVLLLHIDDLLTRYTSPDVNVKSATLLTRRITRDCCHEVKRLENAYQWRQCQVPWSCTSTQVPRRSSPLRILIPASLQTLSLQRARLLGQISRNS